MARRIVIIGLTAALLAALLALAIGSAPSRVVPSDAYRAILLRPSDSHVIEVDGGPRSSEALEVLVAGVDGQARAVRRIRASDVWDHDAAFELSGEMNPDGWLVLYAFHPMDATRAWVGVLVDLTDPARDPLLLDGFGVIGPRFGPGDLLAVTDGMSHRVRVLDLAAPDAPERVVSGVPFLGGLPEIVWAADGSGFLKRGDATSGDLPSIAEITSDHDDWGVVPSMAGRTGPGSRQYSVAPSRRTCGSGSTPIAGF